jgi:transcriptional antiterminator RfaH
MVSRFNQPDGNSSWYIIHCQSRKELYTANTLRCNLGISVYIPEYRLSMHGHSRLVPFFPGYIFAQADLQKVSLSQINTSPGVLRLVAFGGDPQPVPPYVIEEIAERLKQMEMLNQQPFCPGDSVRIKCDGSLQGLEMVFVGPMTPSGRVSVLLSLLGRLGEVDVDAEALEKVPSSTTSERNVITTYPRRERYTRGKGRKNQKVSPGC